MKPVADVKELARKYFCKTSQPWWFFALGCVFFFQYFANNLCNWYEFRNAEQAICYFKQCSFAWLYWIWSVACCKPLFSSFSGIQGKSGPFFVVFCIFQPRWSFVPVPNLVDGFYYDEQVLQLRIFPVRIISTSFMAIWNGEQDTRSPNCSSSCTAVSA
jgi:hypothetical protein